MEKILALFVAVIFVAVCGSLVSAQDVKKGEQDFFTGIEKEIPKDKIKTVDDLNKVWKDVQAKKSKAILIDVRTHPEFDAGHIEGSNLVTLAHVYTMPRRFTDANAEYWIFCRTANRTVYFGWLMNKYGYKNVNVVKGGIVEWLKKGYPLTNRFMGRFKVEEYGHPFKETGPIIDREFVDYKSYYKECIPQE